MIRSLLAWLFAGLSTTLTLSLGMLCLWLAAEDVVLPRAWDPFQPLALSDPDTPVQRWKIARARADYPTCQAALADAAGSLVARDDMRESDHCSKLETIRMASLASMSIKPLDTRCDLALSRKRSAGTILPLVKRICERSAWLS